MSSNLAWVLIIVGGIMECFWVSGLKYADSFTLYILTGLGILISFSCGIIAMKKIEVSVAYAVFVGIGTAGVVLAEMLYFGENFSLIKILLITILVICVIALKFVNKENDDEAFKELSDVVFDEIKEQK
ncbi:DMT family transporter [Campylobacter cuniculorum]|uniref:Multidrug efflux system protein, EmrE family n=2 Tax=Campylobacter cuniculorum TaxID=374106 RepID=A0A1W6BUF6_9BACT|nr:multidrug efflux SMR transporter [Campylobacter cuniculorum]ARJ55716.1 multidrug efflux system protein, EmrE family [Campylobacter cuniculorum DSM 23162 = LMG 24588]QOR04936.1 multidrug efflux SMR transporter [Campylobacter cuniculorum]